MNNPRINLIPPKNQISSLAQNSMYLPFQMQFGGFRVPGTVPLMMGVPMNSMMNTMQPKQPYENKKVWVGKIPENVSDTFMLKLLETCGPVLSWKRVTDSKGKLNTFGICEYVSVESMLKCLRLLNNFPLDDSELQVKIGSETEEFLKKWRERKKAEWIDSLKQKGIEVNLAEIQQKENIGDPLEWELQLVSRDQETLKIIYDLVAQKPEIEAYARQTEKPEVFLKDLKDLASGSLSTHFESDRERERQRKKNDRLKKIEKAFKEEERRWLRHEDEREREKSKIKHEKEYIERKKEKLIGKDLNYDSDEQKAKRAQNPKKYEEYDQMRQKEKEYDDSIRKKEIGILFKNEMNNSGKTSTALALIPQEPEAKTKIEIEEYKIENEEPDSTNKIQVDLKGDIKKPGKLNNKIEEDDDDIYTKKKEVNIIEINPETEKELLEISKAAQKKSAQSEEKSEPRGPVLNFEEMIKEIGNDKYLSLQKMIINLIPKGIDEILKFEINWDIVRDYKIKSNKIKPWLEKKLVEFFDEVDSFSNLLIEKMEKNNPYEILETLKTVLEGDAEEFMCKFWKNLIFETLKVEKVIEEYKKQKSK